jgi:hypothetical protein
VGTGVGVSEADTKSVAELLAEIGQLRASLARMAVAQVEAFNALAEYLGTQGGGALGIFPEAHMSTRAARNARMRMMAAAQDAIEIAAEVIKTDAG